MSSPSDIDSVRAFWNDNFNGDIFSNQTDRHTQAFLDDVRKNRQRYAWNIDPFVKQAAQSGHKILGIGCGVGVMQLIYVTQTYTFGNEDSPQQVTGSL